MGTSSRPLAVCISDIHFNINTLPLASVALQSALDKATALNIPLIIAGDLNDTKAILRGEVSNALISILQNAKVRVITLVGNHDRLNEKRPENSLNFLKPYCDVIDRHYYNSNLGIDFIPYQSSNQDFLNEISKCKDLVVCHQGFKGAYMGDYIQDKSSVDPSILLNVKIFSGHYHRHQTLGVVTYIGSPYTVTSGEANDGAKGYLVLNEDRSFDREILNLRKHIKLEYRWNDPLIATQNDPFSHNINPEDLVWLKVKGPYSELKKLDKAKIGQSLLGHSNFKLDLVPEDFDKEQKVKQTLLTPRTSKELFTTLIDEEAETEEQKLYLKELTDEIVPSTRS